MEPPPPDYVMTDMEMIHTAFAHTARAYDGSPLHAYIADLESTYAMLDRMGQPFPPFEKYRRLVTALNLEGTHAYTVAIYEATNPYVSATMFRDLADAVISADNRAAENRAAENR